MTYFSPSRSPFVRSAAMTKLIMLGKKKEKERRTLCFARHSQGHSSLSGCDEACAERKEGFVLACHSRGHPSVAPEMPERYFQTSTVLRIRLRERRPRFWCHLHHHPSRGEREEGLKRSVPRDREFPESFRELRTPASLSLGLGPLRGYWLRGVA